MTSRCQTGPTRPIRRTPWQGARRCPRTRALAAEEEARRRRTFECGQTPLYGQGPSSSRASRSLAPASLSAQHLQLHHTCDQVVLCGSGRPVRSAEVRARRVAEPASGCGPCPLGPRHSLRQTRHAPGFSARDALYRGGSASASASGSADGGGRRGRHVIRFPAAFKLERRDPRWGARLGA